MPSIPRNLASYLTMPALLAASLLASAHGAGLPDMTVPASCSVQLKENNKDAANLDLVRDAGFAYVRRGFLWSNIEKTPGVYDFATYDALVANAEARGLKVLATLALGNPLYPHVREPQGREAYTRYAAATVAHFRTNAVIWELWNEPNTMTFWGRHGRKGNSEPYADEYVALVKAAVPAMRAADPACTILAGSVSCLWKDSFEWQTYCFRKGILTTGIDGWSVHPYSTKSPEDYEDGYAHVRALMRDIAGVTNMPLLNTERGFPLGKAEGFAGGDPALAAQYQARHLVRQYMMDLLLGVRLTNWYEWSGKEGFSLFSGTPAAGKPMPALDAARVMIGQLRGYTLTERLPLEAPRDYVLRFTDRKGASKLVAWTAPAAGQPPDKTNPHDVTVPVKTTGSLETVQIYGERGSVGVKDGRITLSLTGAPQYISVPAP